MNRRKHIFFLLLLLSSLLCPFKFSEYHFLFLSDINLISLTYERLTKLAVHSHALIYWEFQFNYILKNRTILLLAFWCRLSFVHDMDDITGLIGSLHFFVKLLQHNRSAVGNSNKRF